MIWVCAVVSSFLGSAAASSGGLPLERSAEGRRWVAQETPAPAPNEAEELPPPPPQPGKMPRALPLGGPRRLLGREGARAFDRRIGVSESERNEDATAVPPGSGAAPTSAGQPTSPSTPPPAVAPSSAPASAQSGGNPNVDPEARPQNQKYNFEFAKANIMDVVKLISNITRRNFIVPDSIKSQTITILSPTKISANEAWQVFLSALETSNITVVKAGKFYKLVNSKESLKTTIPTCIGPEDECPQFTEQMVTLILRLNHVDGGQLQTVIKSLGGKDGDVTLFQPSNALIISDYAPNIQRIKRIIEALDVPGFQDELQIVPVQYATATDIAGKLTEVFEVARQGAPRTGANARARVGKEAPAVPPGTPGAPPTGGATDADEGDVQISKIIPDDRTNQLIIKANRQSFDSIKRLIAKLDIPVSDSEQGRVHIYYLENASAEELSSTLASLAQGQPSRAGGRAAPSPNAQPGQPAQQARTGVETAALFEGDIKITADKATNSLLVMSSGRDFRALKRIIEQLDIPRRQVYVEAAIMEVTVDDSLNFGTNWHAPMRFGQNDLPGGAGGPGSIGFVQNPGNGPISPTLAPLTNPASLLGIANGSIVGLVGKAITIPVGDNSITLPSFGIILRALQSASNAQVLSTPHILTTDNEEASIEVGQKIPFRRGTSMPSTGLAGLGSAAGGDAGNALSQLSSFGNLFSSTDRIDVSLKLKLTPQINESDRIRLEIDQQIEDLAGIDEVTQQPKTSTRAAKTVVVVDDQQTIVIGGLMRDIRSDSESKIPLLGDIPIIGWLFKQRTRTTQKVNLVLVLTPYIVRNSNDFQVILERKIKEYEEFAAEFYSNRPEYRAFIDYSRKNGPFARLAQAVVRAKSRAENGGSGDESETVVKPAAGKSENLLAPPSDEVTEAPVDADEESIPVPASVVVPASPSSAPAAPKPVAPAPVDVE